MTNQKASIFRCNCLNIIFAYLAAIALTMNFRESILDPQYTQTAFSEVVWNLKNSISNTSAVSTLLFCMFAYIGRKIDSLKAQKTLLFWFVSVLIACIWLVGKGYRIDNTLYHLHSSFGQIIKSIIYLIGIAWLIQHILYLIFYFIHEKAAKVDYPAMDGLKNVPYRYSFLFSLGILLIAWLPHIIVSYPGYSCPDTWAQLLQFNSVYLFRSHHPVANTVFVGQVVRLGSKLIDGEFGLFLATLLQIIFAALTIAYEIHTMHLLGAPNWLIRITLIICSFVPYYTGYIVLVIKDTLFSIAFLLFVIELIYLLVLKENFFHSVLHVLSLSFAIIMVYLMRNNGKYVLYPFFICFVVYLLFYCASSQSKYKLIKNFIILSLVSIILGYAINNHLHDIYNPIPGSKREALSFFFQQTARYAKTYPAEVTEEEQVIINKVLEYEQLEKLYNPRISDPVKETFKDQASTEDLINYFRIWFKQFLKHPMVYVHAFMNQNYYLLVPAPENDTIYTKTYYDDRGYDHQKIAGFEHIEYTSGIEPNITATGYQKLLFSIPIIGMLSHPATYNLILIAFFLFAVLRNHSAWLIASVPLILSDAVILLSPVIQGHPRYAFPIIFAMPIMIAYYIYLEHKPES